MIWRSTRATAPAYTFIRELGHSFGVEHDPDCKYVMAAYQSDHSSMILIYHKVEQETALAAPAGSNNIGPLQWSECSPL